jgi:transcriptional antiterminator NusG
MKSTRSCARWVWIESKPKFIDIEVGENIRVRTGPFANFEGIVKELLPDRGKSQG